MEEQKVKIIYLIAVITVMASVAACGNKDEVAAPQATIAENITTPEPVATADSEVTQTQTESEAEVVDIRTMNIQIGDTTLTATLEDNEAATALKELMTDGGLTIQFSGYGGFEQVGFIGSSLPTNDVRTSTSAGDIMLYSGNQMVLFYGNHSWAYTRLGKIDNASASELESLLGNGDITATFSLAE